MPEQTLPEGQKFSKTYLARGKPVRDSRRFRTRLAAYIVSDLETFIFVFGQAVETEVGVDFPRKGTALGVHQFFKSAELRDVLDSITVMYRVLLTHTRTGSGSPVQWVRFVVRVLHEENVGYRVDSKGGVHFHVDEEFERNRHSTLQCLSDQRFGGVVTAFESAFERLDAGDTKGAVRSVFEAMETLTKVITNSNLDLDARFVNRTLVPLIGSAYKKVNAAAEGAGVQMVQGLADWVNAAHKYRHGHNEAEPVTPPLELAVLAVSQGASYIRWLVDIDRMAAGG